jgi:hypothetical protein
VSRERFRRDAGAVEDRTSIDAITAKFQKALAAGYRHCVSLFGFQSQGLHGNSGGDARDDDHCKYDHAYHPIMAATKRVPVSEGVWSDLSTLKGPGQTYDNLLASMIEQEKKRRFIEDMDRIEEEEDFVELDFGVQSSD